MRAATTPSTSEGLVAQPLNLVPIALVVAAMIWAVAGIQIAITAPTLSEQLSAVTVVVGGLIVAAEGVLTSAWWVIRRAEKFQINRM
ncbi:hypothetical protein ACFVH4_15665 [Nocardia ignorata]|uniref:hypothetical protein n=1 Tax=Nocardia ignorata TaxID=145285 RepID=UPI00363668CC